MKYELDQLLKKPISGVGYSGSYITSNPKMLGLCRFRWVMDRDAAKRQFV